MYDEHATQTVHRPRLDSSRRQASACSSSPARDSTTLSSKESYSFTTFTGTLWLPKTRADLTQGADCIDLEKLPGIGHCTLTLQITGGTGRFKDASGGILTLTETNVPVLADALNNPVFFASTGEFTGTVSGVPIGDGQNGQ